jgi:hypothetical protein
MRSVDLFSIYSDENDSFLANLKDNKMRTNCGFHLSNTQIVEINHRNECFLRNL